MNLLSIIRNDGSVRLLNMDNVMNIVDGSNNGETGVYVAGTTVLSLFIPRVSCTDILQALVEKKEQNNHYAVVVVPKKDK